MSQAGSQCSCQGGTADGAARHWPLLAGALTLLQLPARTLASFKHAREQPWGHDDTEQARSHKGQRTHGG